MIVDLVIEERCETHRAQHPQPIFLETLRRLANGADQLRLQIRASAHKIDHLVRCRIVKHSVDREIAALCVFFRGREMDCARPPAVEIGVIGAKGGDFELEPVLDHHDDAEMRADRVGARKSLLHYLRGGVCGNVEIFRRFAADDVADTAAGEVGDVAAIAQTGRDFARGLFHGRCFHPSSVAASLCEAQRACVKRLTAASRTARRLQRRLTFMLPK